MTSVKYHAVFVPVVLVLGLYFCFLLGNIRIEHTKRFLTCSSIKESVQLHGTMSHENGTVQLRFEERKRRLDRACMKYRQYVENHVHRVIQVSTSTQRNVTICTIAKCGSRFWDKVLYDMDHHEKYLDLSTTFRDTHVGQNVVFVRNPYVRLLSAYVDKFYAVNTVFWRMLGPFILNQTRRGTVPSRCAHDISFAELVQYILYLYDNGWKNDVHFAPIHAQCGFCELEYTHVGKIETLEEDADFVIRHVLDRKPGSNLHEERRRSILASSKALFHRQRADMEQCGVSFTQGLLRTWKRWQIQGLISLSIPFPVKDNKTVSYREFVEYAFKANVNSKPDDLRRGKEAALWEAFSSLNPGVKTRLKQMYEPEFKMFNYDPHPDFVFGKRSHIPNFGFFTNK